MSLAKEIHPQELIGRFWKRFHRRTPGKVTSIFPRDLFKTVDPEFVCDTPAVSNAAQSWEDAKDKCVARVQEIVEHCKSTNTKFCDKEFDLDGDFMVGLDNCFRGLVRSDEASARPGSVHRVPWIYEKPKFSVGGFSGSDIKQGNLGDCWWLAAIGTIAHRTELMDRICVARDEECGVYGFLFYRDGEWMPVVIDDSLYLSEKDYGRQGEAYDASGKKAREYRKQHQTGSTALYGASCVDPNETWLPLLEKAYAKAHGDYEAIEGGCVGAGVEDLTGGVTTECLTSRVLRKDKLWRELRQVDQENGEFVYGLGAAGSPNTDAKNGIVLGHAYAVVRAIEIDDNRGQRVKLVKIRNPWGETISGGLGEWHGPWSDGSKEWTPEIIKKLAHEFGDDGEFWMSLDDMLNNFDLLYRTRIFDEKWTIAQQWTSLPIGWIPGYLKTKFVITVEKPGLAVIVLSKLDERYFKPLEGEYSYMLEFMVRADGSDKKLAEATFQLYYSESRSVNCEVYLEPGTYDVIPRVHAKRNEYKKPLNYLVKTYAFANPRKLQQKGMLYDTAHEKDGVFDEDAEHERRKEEKRERKRELKRKEEEQDNMRMTMLRMQAAMMEMQAELNRNEVEKHEREEKEKQKGNEKGKGGKKSAGPKAQQVTESAPRAGKNEEEQDENEEGQGEEEAEGDEEEEDNAEAEEEEEGSDDEDYDDDDFDRDERRLWNATCVMGLRVYAEDENVAIEVVEVVDDPVEEEAEGEEEEEGEEGEEEEEE